MSSDTRITANRRNAIRSTGPRSEAGKRRASRNALKHGLTAQQVVMFDEDPTAFETLRDELYAHYQAGDPLVGSLVDHVAACLWRLRRVPEIYAGILADHYLTVQASRASSLGSAPIQTVEEREANERRNEPRPLLGFVFTRAERPLNSLIRIEGAIERSMYRAIAELERIKADWQEAAFEGTVVEEQPASLLPRHRERPRDLT